MWETIRLHPQLCCRQPILFPLDNGTVMSRGVGIEVSNFSPFPAISQLSAVVRKSLQLISVSATGSGLTILFARIFCSAAVLQNLRRIHDRCAVAY